jgi:predicted NUDIX family NTP pyrophosphohydrolase
MAKTSAGLLMYRKKSQKVEVLLVHPGGPFWSKKDLGAWFLPKGELNAGEDPLAAARREFKEETGLEPEGPFATLGEVKHKSGKIVIAWAFEGDWDPSGLTSNTFTMEWPPKSGRQQEFPEVDRAAFFTIPQAREKIHDAEGTFLDRIVELTGATEGFVAHTGDQGTLF